MPTPDFPSPFVIERTQALGFGTGPWTRDAFLQRWNATTADKFISESKAAGWLVSPARGVYHVPAAQDVMLVSWLPEPMRSEFLISRTLAAANIRSWCLSAWCRERGLAFTEPIFVTDLAENTSTTPDRQTLRTRAVGASRRTLPFLDNLLIVPYMPPVGEATPRWAMTPEAPDATNARAKETQLGQLGLGIAGLLLFAVDKQTPSELATQYENLHQRETNARGIPYAVDGAISDEDWVTALLAAIGTSRIEELVSKTLRPKAMGRWAAIQRWSALIGPPQPVASWKETLAQGPFPHLLIPPPLWAEMGADQAARRYRMLDQLAKGD